VCGREKSKLIYVHLCGVLGGVLGSLIGFTFFGMLGALLGGLLGIMASEIGATILLRPAKVSKLDL
jgi:hypothetical protein